MNYKTIIAPFIAVLAIMIQLITGIQLEADVQTQIIDAITAVISVALVVYGIIKNHKLPPIE